MSLPKLPDDLSVCVVAACCFMTGAVSGGEFIKWINKK